MDHLTKRRSAVRFSNSRPLPRSWHLSLSRSSTPFSGRDQMGFGGLAIFVVVMWTMILAVAASLVIFIAPIDMIMFDGRARRLTGSVVQAGSAIIVVVASVC